MRSRILPPLIAVALRLLARTWRVSREGPPPAPGSVLAILHGEMLPMIGLHRTLPLMMLASLSRDGELAAQVLPRLGVRVARGSGSRGGREGLAALGEGVAEGLAAIVAVDGSRGPYGVPKPGALVLASRQAAPLVAVRAFSWPALRLRSWDHFCIPLPFARIALRYRIVALPDEGPAAFDAAMAALNDALSEAAGPMSRDPLT